VMSAAAATTNTIRLHRVLQMFPARCFRGASATIDCARYHLVSH
jgi:hypothetical protein